MWKNERLGLIMIFASLLAITVIIVFLFSYQQESREAQIRVRGIGLVRLLSSIPHGQLVPTPGGRGILQVMERSQNDPDLAYVAVIDAQGRPLAEVAAPGVVIPTLALPSEPSNWVGERIVKPAGGAQTLFEYHAPLFDGSDLSGYVRVGYFKPRFGPTFEQLPFFATLALPVFLLTPVFYLLVKHEVRPLRVVNAEIGQLLESGDFHRLKVTATGELGEFMRRFNTFIDAIQGQVRGLKSEQTELLTSTKILAYKRSRVEAVLQTLPDAVVVLDESGMVSYANERLSSLIDVSLEEVVGHRPAEWCNHDSLSSFLSRHEVGGSMGIATDSLRFSPECRPEQEIEVRIYPLFSPKDASQLLGTLMVFRDTTEEGLARRSRGEFVAQVAHELKTPLNVLSMYSESLLGEDGRSESFRIEAVNVIHDEAERLATLINNLLGITKIETGGMDVERQRVRLHELLEDAFSNVAQSGRGKGLNFQLDLPKELSAVYVDKDLLRIAINNLLTNAIKYNQEGGSVTLSAEEFEGSIRIGVRDTGIGIDANERERIFEKFYRSNDEQVREQTGHGLGLPLVRQIIQLHHGELRLESELGQGSQFAFELPKENDSLKQVV